MAQTIMSRPFEPRQTAPKGRARSGSRSTVSSVVMLARWQLRQTWYLLLVIGMGMLLAVILVCAVSLYTQVATSAGIRHAVAENPQNLFITVHARSQLFSASQVKTFQKGLTDLIRNDLGAMVSSSPDLSVQISALNVTPTNSLQVIGADMSRAASHLKVLQGRLPAANSGNTLEFAVVAQGQKDLGLQLNRNFALPYALVSPLDQLIVSRLNFRLVGVVASPNPDDLFWHGESLLPVTTIKGLFAFETVPILVSNSELMAALSQISSLHPAQDSNANVGNSPDIFWYYPIDFSHVDIHHLPNLISGVTAVLTGVGSNLDAPPSVIDTTVTGSLNALQDYRNRVTVLQLSTTYLAYLIAGLLLFFVLLMMGVLVERQMEAITLLRSRGASARQVFGSLLGQGVGVGLLAFVAGPLLSVPLVAVLVNLTLVPGDRYAFGQVIGAPLATLQNQFNGDMLVVGVGLLGMIWSIWQVLHSNVLVQKRESARASRPPFWMRFKLDAVAAIIALASFGFSLYIAGPGVLNIQTRVLILPLTSMVGVLFLLLCCLLLFLRIFPYLLRLGERMVARKRGVAPVLALAQLARSPRQPLRLTLLFSLAVAFALFTLIYAQSEAQRLVRISEYQVGSDFSGTIPALLAGDSWNQQMAFYRSLKGVTSVTLGTTVFMAGGSNGATFALAAVDSSTYAKTMYWTTQDSSQPIGRLTGKLLAERNEAEAKEVIPAIIDDAAAQSLGVGIGRRFVLADYHGPVNFVVVGIVHNLPTIYDTAGGAGSDTSIVQGGVLVDFQTYSAVALALYEEGVDATNVWVRTDGRPATLGSVRGLLFNGNYALSNGLDRQALFQSLATDPLYLVVLNVLGVGTVVALLLGLMGNLLAVWWNARSRRISFAILRALGCEPAQIVHALLWEQGIVYGVGLALGTIVGLVLSLLLVPAFVFSPLENASSTEAFYLAQSTPAVQTAIPLWSIVSLLVGLVVACALALAIMLRVVIQPQVSQTLRVSED
ncbi:MAG TPA: FtsX-like permease family protein [Ktedonobacteraceae bacterium]|nr:FtsX-like permease family protein [Ktedonobacteraceae bacterium]